MRHRLGRIGRGLGHVERERQVAFELRLHQLLVVGEHERRVRLAFAELRRPCQRSPLGVREVGGLTVGHVQHVGRQPRLEAGNRRVVAVAGQREVDRVVRGGCAGLPALRVQQVLPEGVVVDLEREVGPVVQRHHRLRLGLGSGRWATVGVAADLRRRALLVVPEVLGEVAVGIDAVGARDLGVAVVVAQVLAPQSLGVEGVLVAVRVGHDDEPELVVLEEVLGLLVVGSPAVDERVQQSPVHLGGDPLPRVLRRAVEHCRPGAVGDASGALGQLQRDDLATLVGVAEHHELDQLRVLLREAVELVADAALLVPGPPDGVTGLGLLGSQLLDGLAVLVLLDLDIETPGLEAFRLVSGEHDVEAHAGIGDPAVGDVEAAGGDHRRVRGGHVRRVHVQGARIIIDGVRADGKQHREHHGERGDTDDEAIWSETSAGHEDSSGPSPASGDGDDVVVRTHVRHASGALRTLRHSLLRRPTLVKVATRQAGISSRISRYDFCC